MTDDDRIAKLPAWAQDRIRTLTMRVVELRAQLASEQGADEAPWYNAHVHDPSVEQGYAYVPTPHRRVRFYSAAGKDERRNFFDIRLTDDPGSLKFVPGSTLLVHGGGGIVVIPHASNAVGIRIAE